MSERATYLDHAATTRLREQAADPRAARAERAGHLRLGGVLEVAVGILRRADKRGKSLPEPLRLALEAVVASGLTASSTAG